MITTPLHVKRDSADYQLVIISSPAFSQNGVIPLKYACDGLNVSPGLNFQNIPYGTKSLALVVDDPDALGGHCTHWIVWNIPVTRQIKEGRTSGTTGLNDYGQHAYTGPSTHPDIHRYYFIVYALDCLLNIPDSSGVLQLEIAMKHHILGFGILTGRYVGVRNHRATLSQANY